MDEIFMLTALAQSSKALPQCLPNPPVGCVIVENEKIVAQGYVYMKYMYLYLIQILATMVKDWKFSRIQER
jgi:hypothetical protein